MKNVSRCLFNSLNGTVLLFSVDLTELLDCLVDNNITDGPARAEEPHSDVS